MSISHAREHGDRDEMAAASSDAAGAIVPPSSRRAIAGYAHVRKLNPPDELALATRKWLSRLPQHVRPINLLEQYPRVVNRVAAAWDNPSVFGELATDLLYDFRGGRAGFPPEIIRELRALREYYYQSSSPKA